MWQKINKLKILNKEYYVGDDTPTLKGLQSPYTQKPL